MAAIDLTAVPTGDIAREAEPPSPRMVTRAWREAARCWAEYRAEPNGSTIKRLLLTSAEEAESYWHDLSAAAASPVTSPWVARASRSELPSRCDGPTTDRRVVR